MIRPWGKRLASDDFFCFSGNNDQFEGGGNNFIHEIGRISRFGGRGLLPFFLNGPMC
jgi:hypothetical protein